MKDIAEECGINRNTFYYHYADLPALLQEILNEEIDRIIEEHPDLDSLEDCLVVAARFASANRKAILHVYHSVNREMFEQYLWQSCEQTISIYFEKVLPDIQLSENDRNILRNYHICEAYGILSGWLKTGMRGDLGEFLRQVIRLRKLL